MSVTLGAARARPAGNAGFEELVLTPVGHVELDEEYERLTTVTRPEAATRLGRALQAAGDLGDNSECLEARAELDLVDERIALLERRLHAARVLRPDELSNREIALGSEVLLEDLDDGAREKYVLVSSAESSPAEGRLSKESPVGKAIAGHHQGDVVDVRAPHRVRHLRIVKLRASRPTPVPLDAAQKEKV